MTALRRKTKAGGIPDKRHRDTENVEIRRYMSQRQRQRLPPSPIKVIGAPATAGKRPTRKGGATQAKAGTDGANNSGRHERRPYTRHPPSPRLRRGKQAIREKARADSSPPFPAKTVGTGFGMTALRRKAKAGGMKSASTRARSTAKSSTRRPLGAGRRQFACGGGIASRL